MVGSKLLAEKGEYREVFVTFVRQKTLGRELVNTERGRTREGSDFSAAARAENPLPQKPEYRTRPSLRELGVACSRNKKNRSELLMRKNAPLCSVVFSKSSATLTASLPISRSEAT